LERKRQELQEEEEKELTFQPTLSSRKTSERLLARASTARIPCTQAQDLVAIKEQRNIKRSKMARDVEDREASFQPQINKKSLLINEELRRRGQVSRDEVTKQSCVTPNRNVRKNTRRAEKGPEGSRNDPGHEEEIFTPRITRLARKLDEGRHDRVLNRSALNSAQRNKEDAKAKIFDRLYTEAVEKGKLKKKERVALLQTFHKDVNIKMSDDPEGTLSRSTSSLNVTTNRKLAKEQEYLNSMITTSRDSFIEVQLEDLNQKRAFYDVFASLQVVLSDHDFEERDISSELYEQQDLEEYQDAHQEGEEDYMHQSPHQQADGVESPPQGQNQAGSAHKRFLHHRHSHFPQGQFSRPDMHVDHHNYETPTK
jgi:hypothetical protein